MRASGSGLCLRRAVTQAHRSDSLPAVDSIRVRQGPLPRPGMFGAGDCRALEPSGGMLSSSALRLPSLRFRKDTKPARECTRTGAAFLPIWDPSSLRSRLRGSRDWACQGRQGVYWPAHLSRGTPPGARLSEDSKARPIPVGDATSARASSLPATENPVGALASASCQSQPDHSPRGQAGTLQPNPLNLPPALTPHGNDPDLLEDLRGELTGLSPSSLDSEPESELEFHPGLVTPIHGPTEEGAPPAPALTRGFFPLPSEFPMGRAAPALSSAQVLALLHPYMSEGRLARMQEVIGHRTVGVVPVVEGLQDLGNVSAVLRSADALGFLNVHVISNRGRGPVFRNRARVSQGADKWLFVEQWQSTPLCFEELRRRGYRIAVTSLTSRSVPIYDLDWTVPTAIVFGNEKRGVTEECLTLADTHCSIPMLGMVESFNISVAAALVLHHALRDRLARQGEHGDLSEEQQRVLLAHYALRHRGDISKALVRHLVKKEQEQEQVLEQQQQQEP